MHVGEMASHKQRLMRTAGCKLRHETRYGVRKLEGAR